jgi:hypothetical protein
MKNFKASMVQWKAHDAVGPSSSLMGIISFQAGGPSLIVLIHLCDGGGARSAPV